MNAVTRRPLPAALASLAFAVAVSAPLALGFFKNLHPAFDSLAHFRAHLAVLLAIAALPLLIGPLRREGLIALVLGFAAFVTVLGVSPYDLLRKPDAEASSPKGATYRLLQLNLRYDNGTPEKVLSVIGQAQPDVVTLDEVSAMWLDRLALLEKAYPYRIICDPPTPIGGVAILSRRPFAANARPTCHDRGSMAVAHVDFGGRAIDVVALHLGWPWPFGHHAQISRIEGTLRALGETALLAGDFNATPWSAAAARVAAAGDLKLAKGVRPTWLHRAFPDSARRIAGLPIDQILTKGAVVVGSIRTLGGTGSDHLAVLLEFSLTPEPRPGPAILEARLSANRFR